ncbi:MAG: DUF2344 domain-containing protein, partial [Firmicutes bacterium]|nr:DUF2344 domain-containing protein [Bacillota bacterium]
MPKFRARFERQAAVMWISHLNIMKALQQALRRSGLVAATRGTFNPHVKLAVAVPLPVGVTSEAEYLEVELVEPVKGEEFKERMNRNLPPGLKLLAVSEAPAGAPPLASRINGADYVLKVRAESAGDAKATEAADTVQASPGPIPAGSERFWVEVVRDLLGRESLRVVRNTPRGSREIDLRPL